MNYHQGAGVEVRIAHMFNTYGPWMCLDDGRVGGNFVSLCVIKLTHKQPMTIYGDV
ncbi:putative UDP-glucuronate decarboxylase [Helianthus annuus]|uniref:UDP-glucuronate decarboxylase n=2 Tax=Helianthus annuus TaxID=4232 RepID=A0A9K3IB40_HELAN|nr:putative UDP-glucuronate decarboxylase [Helianthus annuus]KAJ0528274.1 putative UDP-glucuronate decarboxylase [Helianthus annuus]KAJ0544704.1 putative UDP-glucuronate decarboxylase [Helianthus annuus]KAJ0709706.1 putative UDP-glucuronate decarboxylase [Helianthus annuus]KAJ0713578.1 putative UDP-glucuronate decarboxylase [Helianthus annuus]